MSEKKDRVPSPEEWKQRNANLLSAADWHEREAKRTKGSESRRHEGIAAQARSDVGKKPQPRTWPHFATEEEVGRWPEEKRGGRAKKHHVGKAHSGRAKPRADRHAR